MKRGFTEQEWETASLLAELISSLDEINFPDNPIVVLLVKEEFGRRGEKFGYTSKEDAIDFGAEHYVIFAYGIDGYLERILEKEEVILLVDNHGELLDSEDLPPLTLQILLVGVASHEVRHRLQQYSLVKMFSPVEADKTKDPHLRGHVGLRRRLFELRPPRQKYPQREFDAKLIEFLVREEIHRGGDRQSILDIIKLEPE